MNNKDYYYKQFFKDRPGSAKPAMYAFNDQTKSYDVIPVPDAVSTSATQRIGMTVDKDSLTAQTFEETGVGGKRIGRIILYDNEIGSDNLKTHDFDAGRDGNYIKNYKHMSSPRFRPLIRVSPPRPGVFENETSDVIDHSMKLETYGVGKDYKTVDDAYNYIPFTDFSQVSPVTLINIGPSLAFPFVYDNLANLSQYLDRSHPRNDGAVDVFESRVNKTTFSISDIQIKGCKSSLMGGSVSSTNKGTSQITDIVEVRKNSNNVYYDSEEKIFNNYDFPVVGERSSASTSVKSLPGLIDDSNCSFAPFIDDTNLFGDSYGFTVSIVSIQDFIANASTKISEVGTRFKSSTRGLIYGESNLLGTDSIAFGGLKK